MDRPGPSSKSKPFPEPSFESTLFEWYGNGASLRYLLALINSPLSLRFNNVENDFWLEQEFFLHSWLVGHKEKVKQLILFLRIGHGTSNRPLSGSPDSGLVGS